VVAVATGRARAGERELFATLFGRIGPGTVVVADRGFLSYDLWGRAAATGAALLWRAKSTTDLPVLEVLADGSYRSQLSDPTLANKRRDQIRKRVRRPVEVPGHPVRVIEYRVEDRHAPGVEPELYRLVTTVIDPRTASAEELAAMYYRRWELESTFDEIKSTQRGPGVILRSKSPPMVHQELYALLLTHYAIRELMLHVADREALDIERLSFTRSLRVVRRQVTDQAGFSP
jgi:hypothetical protein